MLPEKTISPTENVYCKQKIIIAWLSGHTKLLAWINECASNTRMLTYYIQEWCWEYFLLNVFNVFQNAISWQPPALVVTESLELPLYNGWNYLIITTTSVKRPASLARICYFHLLLGKWPIMCDQGIVQIHGRPCMIATDPVGTTSSTIFPQYSFLPDGKVF